MDSSLFYNGLIQHPLRHREARVVYYNIEDTALDWFVAQGVTIRRATQP
jgi:hypothetical protein